MSIDNTVASTSNGDDANITAGQDGQNFDDIPVPMGSFAEALGLTESLPDEDDESTLDPEDSADDPEDPEVPEVDTADEDDTDDPEDNASEEDDDEDDSDEDSTQDSEISDEDVDWEFKVPVKVDGEIQHLTLEELRKGYSTDQHLSKKGREISEQEKTLKEDYDKRIAEVDKLSEALLGQLQTAENELAKEYHEINAEIDKAREEGNTYELSELKDKREQAQEKYWQARKRREGLGEEVQKKRDEANQQVTQELMKQFNTDIQELVPDFDEKLAGDVRDFAIAEGIPQELLGAIFDARVVKFINDYRVLKTNATKGQAKRKAKPKVKGAPIKKSNPTAKKKRADTELRSKVFSGEGSEAEELSFLKGLTKFQ